MPRRILGMLAIASTLAWGQVQAAPITYELKFDDGQSGILKGFNMTNGATGGPHAGDTTPRSFEAIGGPVFSIAVASPSQHPSLPFGATDTAVSTQNLSHATPGPNRNQPLTHHLFSLISLWWDIR